MGGDVFNFDGQKRACAHMQRDFGEIDAFGGQGVQQRLIEMQAGSGGGNGACVAGKDGLVIRGILRIGGAFCGDIGRQRHQTGARQRRVEIGAGQIELQVQIGV